jgi:hypothetical protein
MIVHKNPLDSRLRGNDCVRGNDGWRETNELRTVGACVRIIFASHVFRPAFGFILGDQETVGLSLAGAFPIANVGESMKERLIRCGRDDRGRILQC